MQKIALITDSACDLDLETLHKENIKLLPLRIIYSTGDYADRLDLSPSDVYTNLDKEVPKTSLPSIESMEDTLKELENEGYTHVIAICISSGLSGSYNALRLLLEDHPNLTSYAFDTKILAYPQGEIVLEVSELIKAGKSFEEIIAALPEIRSRVNGYFTIGTLDYLIKGGRIGRVSGAIGNILSLKPIITTDDDGIYYNIAKVRGRKQSISKLTDILNDYLAKGPCSVAVLEGGCIEEAEKYMDSIKDLPNITNIKIAQISPALGVHGGPGLLGLSIKLVK